MDRKVVLCHGVFDVLHAGHIAHLERAKSYGDYLVVSVTADKYVNKGPKRPFFPDIARAKMLRALSIVDDVLISDSASAVPIIKRVKPAFYVKGNDYEKPSTDVTGKIHQERMAVEAHGGKLVFTNEETFSSSAVINACLQEYSPEQRVIIDAVNSLGGIKEIRDILETIKSELKAVVAGECIFDVYRYVRPEGISSKSPTISCRSSHEETSYGGAWAINNHIKEFCQSTLLASGVAHEKIRYISVDTGQRLFEVTNIPEDPGWINGLPEHNLFIGADFGHGYFDKFKPKTDQFKAWNVQTNSSNFGFNVLTKLGGEYDYLVADKRELQLAFNNRTSSIADLGSRSSSAGQLAVTLGPGGACLFKGKEQYCSPAFTNKIIDATGAGDAFFAITALFTKAKAPPEITLFVGNVFAALKTQIMGNKESVSKAALIKACEAILK